MQMKSYANLFVNCFILLLVLAIASVFLSSNFNTFTQVFAAKGKTVKRGFLPPNHPTEISELKIGDTLISDNQIFENHNSNWLKDLSFKIKNFSYKRIVYFQVQIDFPDTKKTGPIISHKLSYGIPPTSKIPNVVQAQPEKPSINFASGEEFTVKVNDKYPDLEHLINLRNSMTDTDKVLIRFGLIVFEDGTRWDPNMDFTKEDPKNPGTQIYTEPLPLINEPKK